MLFKTHGILGINARNLLYIRPYNKKKAVELADDKIKTKKFLEARDIPVPKMYGVIKSKEELEKFEMEKLPNSFALKPNFGYGGEGIIPIINKRGSHWIKVNGEKITKEELNDQIVDILDGRFSISNVSDSAFFEQLIISHDSIGKFAYEGLPDIRVVVHNLIPVMAMLRIPTKESGGRANLHQGAIGAGIDIAKGEVTYVAYKHKIIDEIPGVGKIKGTKIPFWDEILMIASKAQLATNLGYLAADIALDKTSGPLLIEINARAGLGVQIANLAPLRRRLERIEGVKVTTPEKGIRIAKDMFGNVMEKELAHKTGKEIIGAEEEIEIILGEGTVKIKAAINTNYERTVIDEQFADEMKLLENHDAYDDEKSTLKLKFSIRSKRTQTIADVEPLKNTKYKIIIGNRDLKDFLIDPSKSPVKDIQISKESKRIKKELNYYEIDQQIVDVSSKLKLLYHLRPTNLEEEKKKFFKDFKYNPQFKYPELRFDPSEVYEELEKIETDDTALGKVFQAKVEELKGQVSLMESIGKDEFTEKSIDLFGKPGREVLEEVEAKMKKIDSIPKDMEGTMKADEVKKRFDEVFKKYKLKNWKAKLKDDLVADCTAGKRNRLLLRKDATFSEERIKALIVHEIETHILTAENGKNQPYEIFNRGLANYMETQEGLAIYNVTKRLHYGDKQNYRAFALVIAIAEAQEKSFVEVFEKLLQGNIPLERAFRTAIKVKRGLTDTSKPGCFTKDLIYYTGMRKIEKYVEEKGDIKDLYMGKFSLEDLETVKRMEGIKPPKYLPEWLSM
ncbi:MAG: tyrosine/phenylalanine carboxypeptidase domain-containing protein [Patescibacteria group bacterium]|nr:DUF1704 domain-containing protein [Patescibacteria group bacterium]